MNKLIPFFAFAFFTSAAGASDFFAKPQEACSALDSIGLITGGWKPSKAFQNEWVCLSDLEPFGSSGSNGLKNNIAFYVNGTSRNRANDFRVKINVNNASEKVQAFTRLKSAVYKLFEFASQPVPPELSAALTKQRPGSWQTSWGKAELVLEDGRMESFKVILTDAKYLQQVEDKRVGASGDFERCKQVVAKAAGYSVSLLSGNGNPVQESSYKSFMLKGRNNDIFFCEVHGGGRYKIKAALNGKFPFKYIAEGSL